MNDVARQMNPHQLQWLREQVQAASDFKIVYEELRRLGLSDHDIAAALDTVRPLGSALATGRLEPPPLIRRAPPGLRRLEIPDAEVYTWDDFLGTSECAKVIGLINHNLGPSPIARPTDDPYYRNSRTCALSQLRSPTAAKLDDKICKGIGIRPEYAEGIQAQRYDVGQQFKPHWDSFEPGTQDWLRFAELRGNRTWTFMVYLNDGMEGGGTTFTKSNYTVTPKTGMALLWNNLKIDGSVNPATMHCGEPVTQGFKVIITKWFRVLGNGPQFYS